MRPRVATEREPRPERLPARGRPRLRPTERGPLAVGHPRRTHDRADAPLGSRGRRREDARREGARGLVVRERVHGGAGNVRGLRRVGLRLDLREPHALPRTSAGHAPDRTREHDCARPLPPRLRRGGARARLSGPRRPGRPRPAGRRRLVSGERRRRSTLERGARLPRRLPCAAEPDRAARHSRRPGRPACRSRGRRRRRGGDPPRGRRGRPRRRCVLLPGDPPALGDRPAGDAGAARAPGRGRPPRRRAAPRPLRRQRRVGAVGRPAGRHASVGPATGSSSRRTRC